MEDVVSNWRGRRVFLTGHTGFKGGWLAVWLAKLGAEVRGYALDPETSPNLFNVASVARGIDDLRGDVRDLQQLKRAVHDFAPTVVFHLAAQPLVRRSFVDPIGTLSTNVLGTAHVLEAVRDCPSVCAVVSVTTDKCYENQEWIWPYRETDPLGGHDPYAASKACAEIVSAAYRKSFFSVPTTGENRVAVATARAGNVIGGGDWSQDRLIPDLIRGFTSGESALIRRPAAIRPWQHVLEPLHGYLLLAERLLAHPEGFSTAFNFGPWEDDAWPVERIADAMCARWGRDAQWVRDDQQGTHEATFLRLDASKARAMLDWAPRLRIEDALQWTVDWYRAHFGGTDMRAMTEAQIDAYQRLSA